MTRMQAMTASVDRGRGTFAALRYPNYRRWFWGQMTSLLGTWMQSTAQGYLVFELTRSEAYLGYVGFAGGLATWIFTLYGGVVADRVSRRSLLVLTQSLSMLLAFALSILAFTRVVAPWHIIGLAFMLGTVNAFDAPARQSFVLEMVDRPMLTNAIALNSTMFNMATAVGPAAGGLVYALLGPGWCFAINGLSFAAVIGALASMRLPPRTARTGSGSALAEIREGLRVVAADKRIAGIIALLGSLSLFGMSFITLLPAWAVQTLGGDARTNGFLQSARGVGALAAALSIAAMAHRRFKGRLMTACSVILPLGLVAFSFTRSLWLSLAALVAIGGLTMTVINLANAMVQTLVPDAVRGRVMGIYTLFFFGFMPIGALLAGAAATAIGAPLTIAFSSVGLLACAAGIALAVPSIRRLD
jgi:MFS family permease